MTFRIGDCEVLPDLLRIRRGEDVIEVEPRVMAVLEELAREPGRVVTRDDLHRSVWSDVIVTDDALNRCIRELRRILGDDARAPRFIETISKRGYRLIAPVQHGPAAVSEPKQIEAEVEVEATTLFGHRAVVHAAGDRVIRLRRENVVLTATPNGQRFDVRTRILSAAFPLASSLGAFVIVGMLLYGRTLQFGHSIALSLIAGIAGWIAGTRQRRRALDLSRAAIEAFARSATAERRRPGG